ncbi:MAG: hypothetical protein HC852_22190 [Acaryochloridaceae cyanobacterium RU_4_10]|nr:hypothetical protein [Acaryochloridaceae cyanobacterium RU_4_10]
MANSSTVSGLIAEATSREVNLCPVIIPETNPGHYISFKHALNLRFADEDTGDWHFQSAFFNRADYPSRNRSIPLAGEGETVNTVPSLGTRGVRDMAEVLIQEQIPILPNQSVYVANHYRAIADLAMMDLQEGKMPICVTNQAINSWLDTPEQIEHLKQYYLEPIANQLSGQALRVFKEWILTVSFV